MAVTHSTIPVSTRGHSDMLDLTKQVAAKLDECGLRNGNVTVFVTGSTAGLSTVEYEPGLLKDIPAAYEKIAPERADYKHHATWGDDNGSSHVRATMLGPSLVIPFIDGVLQLGQWQQIVLIDFDTRPRDRQILVQFMGE